MKDFIYIAILGPSDIMYDHITEPLKCYLQLLLLRFCTHAM